MTEKNPTFGLRLWGPLIPASDCKPCLATLATIQLGAGALLWWKPGRRPPLGRSVFANRVIKTCGVLAGSYLILTAGLEYTRLALPYDPWAEDARAARKHYAMKTGRKYTKGLSWSSPASWKFAWFGAPDFEAVPWSEWQKRTSAYLAKSDKAQAELEGMSKLHATLADANKATANNVLQSINSGEFPAPEVPVEELEALEAFPDMGDDDELFDELDVQTADLWDFFEEANAFAVIVVPRSTPAFLPGVKISEEDGFKSQNVNYLPIPQSVKTALR